MFLYDIVIIIYYMMILLFIKRVGGFMKYITLHDSRLIIQSRIKSNVMYSSIPSLVFIIKLNKTFAILVQKILVSLI